MFIFFEDVVMKIKDKRKQMTSTFSRDLASHIADVSYVNSIPVSEKWVTHKELPRGFLKLLIC